MTGGMERAPRLWNVRSPHMGLAIAITLQAKQDLRKGARYAQLILEPRVPHELKRKAAVRMWRCRADTAVGFFSSRLWNLICGTTSSGKVHLPPDLVRDIETIRRAYKLIAEQWRKTG